MGERFVFSRLRALLRGQVKLLLLVSWRRWDGSLWFLLSLSIDSSGFVCCCDLDWTEEESDEFYELTPTDYYRLVASKKEGNLMSLYSWICILVVYLTCELHSSAKDKSLKTRKLREAEEAARRAKLTKVLIHYLSCFLLLKLVLSHWTFLLIDCY